MQKTNLKNQNQIPDQNKNNNLWYILIFFGLLGAFIAWIFMKDQKKQHIIMNVAMLLFIGYCCFFIADGILHPNYQPEHIVIEKVILKEDYIIATVRNDGHYAVHIMRFYQNDTYLYCKVYFIDSKKKIDIEVYAQYNWEAGDTCIMETLKGTLLKIEIP